jgi:hypothetical protein
MLEAQVEQVLQEDLELPILSKWAIEGPLREIRWRTLPTQALTLIVAGILLLETQASLSRIIL